MVQKKKCFKGKLESLCVDLSEIILAVLDGDAQINGTLDEKFSCVQAYDWYSVRKRKLKVKLNNISSKMYDDRISKSQSKWEKLRNYF